MNGEFLSSILRICIAALIVIFTVTIGVKMAFFIANAQITHEATITASVPLWFEVTTSTDTVYVRSNGHVVVSNYENGYK